jgi:hypothetical protein
MGGLADSLNRSRENINAIAQSLQTHFQKQDEEEKTRKFQEMIRNASQAPAPTHREIFPSSGGMGGVIPVDKPVPSYPQEVQGGVVPTPMPSAPIQQQPPSRLQSYLDAFDQNPEIGVNPTMRNLWSTGLETEKLKSEIGDSALKRQNIESEMRAREHPVKSPFDYFREGYFQKNPNATNMDMSDAWNKSQIGLAGGKVEAGQQAKTGKSFIPKNVQEARAWSMQTDDPLERSRRSEIADVMEKQLQTNANYSQKAKFEGTLSDGSPVTFRNNQLFVTKPDGTTVPYDKSKDKEVHLIGEASNLATALERGKAFAYGRALYNYKNVIDTGTGEITNVNNLDIAQNPDKYIDASTGQKIMNKASLVEDIRGNIDQTRSAVKNLDNDFDAVFRTNLAVALRQPDPRSAISSLISSIAPEEMSPSQLDFLNSLNFLTENAMAMRSVLGAGQGSEDLRNAIIRTLPGVMSPDKAYAQKQLDLFENTLDRLKKGIPMAKGGKPILSGGTQTPKGSASTGKVKVRRKSDGATGEMSEEAFKVHSDKYERVQ